MLHLARWGNGQAAAPSPGQITQISVIATEVGDATRTTGLCQCFALCADGSVWRLQEWLPEQWSQISAAGSAPPANQTNTPMVAAGNTGVINGCDVMLSGQAPARAVTTISLLSADLGTTFWSVDIDLTAANQAAVIPMQSLIDASTLSGIDLSPGLTLQTVAATVAPNWTISATVNVTYYEPARMP